jgi:hypothetical protein
MIVVNLARKFGEDHVAVTRIFSFAPTCINQLPRDTRMTRCARMIAVLRELRSSASS